MAKRDAWRRKYEYYSPCGTYVAANFAYDCTSIRSKFVVKWQWQKLHLVEIGSEAESVPGQVLPSTGFHENSF